MKISDMHFPRKLEADDCSEKIRAILAAKETKLYPEGGQSVPLLLVHKSLADALKKVQLQRRVFIGLEDIMEKLAAEKKGLDLLRRSAATPGLERISRLLLFSNDGAPRLYHSIEQTLILHHPRLLGMMLDIDSSQLGKLITGRASGIKVILIDHKDAASEILQSLV